MKNNIKKKLGAILVIPTIATSVISLQTNHYLAKANDNGYRDEKELFENKEKSTLVPQDYLIVYDYYGMKDELKAKGWEIIKSLANSTAKGSRFMIQLTKSQLNGHSKMGDGNKTTKLISSDEIKNMKSPSELESKLLNDEPNTNFFDKYQSSLRGNSTNGISALYVFDNWTTATKEDGTTEKEQYDTNFIKYLKDHNANTVMAVALYDEKNVKENLVPDQSKAIGFNNYYINENPDLSKITEQFLTTSKSYTKDSHSYKVSVNSSNGVKLKNAKVIIDNQSTNLKISDDGLTATSEISDNKVGRNKATIVYEYDDNTTDKDVTIKSSMTSNGQTIQFNDKVVKGKPVQHISKKGNVVVKYVDMDGKEIQKSVNVLTNSDYGTKYDTTKLKAPKIEKDGHTYILDTTNQNNNEIGSVTSDNTEIIYKYKEMKTGNVIIRYVDDNGHNIKDDEKLINNAVIGAKYDATMKKIPEIVKDGKLYRLTNEKITNETGTVSEKNQVVTYKYTEVKKGTVSVRFVDENNKEIKKSVDVLVNSNQGTSYDSSKLKEQIIKASTGQEYEFNSIVGNEKGVLDKDNIIITFKYKEIKGDVVLKYVNEVTGEDIIDKKNIVTNGSLSLSYDTTSLNKEFLFGKDGKLYKLMKVDGEQKGKVTKGTKEIILKYIEVKTNVFLKFVDENDNQLKLEKVLSNSSVASDYDVSSYVPKTLNINNETYIFDSANDNLIGKTSIKDTIVTVKYKKEVKKVLPNTSVAH